LFDVGMKNKISEILPDAVFDEPMSRHTTFRVGGPCDAFLDASADNLQIALDFCTDNDIPYMVIGNGSNLVCSDDGIRGFVISIGTKMNKVTVNETEITAESGIRLSRLAATAADECLGGLEFASGIPGNLGGALYMNAGAYGGEMKNVVKNVTFIENGKIITKDIDELDFGYRTTYFTKHDTVILSCTMSLQKKNHDDIIAEMEDYAERRRSKQPLEYPSAGSFFKRPEGYFAGKLIQDSGLMGVSVGGAQVSTKHAGFIINTGNATCEDIKKLRDHVIQTVNEKFGVTLETEVKFVG
jgi:UDP-N-acetylmuramate dehydrogenase